jgi:RimJ/RimL family protein N-acetyltransferase
VFASGSDVWSAPTSLSGSIEVAGDIRFDEDDEDDLRRRVKPEYKLSPPPGQTTPRLVLSTNYSPRRGQNLVASLDGWVDDRGRAQLASRILAGDPITPGPAQISRLVFSTPRVSRLLGLRNLELRDLDKSSLDSVSLGTPHLLYLARGIVQIQSLYKGASGPGVSRMIGVTAFLNGRAGVGSDVEDAVRQAPHEPPRVEVLKPRRRPVVGTPVELRFRVHNARREVMTIASPAGRQDVSRSIKAGLGSIAWVPSAPGRVRVRVAVEGMDESQATGSTAFRVLSPAPAVRVTSAPARARVGRPIRFSFTVTHALNELAEVSTRDGTFTRRYRIRTGTGLLEWTPTTAGRAELRIRARGRERQTASDSARFTVASGPRVVAPAVTPLQVPDHAAVGRESEIAFRVAGSRVVTARIAGDGGYARVWRFVRPADRVAFAWTPAQPGGYAKGSRHAVTAEIHATRRSRRGAARWLARCCSRPLASVAQVDRRTTGTDEARSSGPSPPHARILSDSAPVGTAGLFQISHAHGCAAFAIALGERRGQGLGTEATRLALDFAFHVLRLRNVRLETLEWNVAGLTAYERAGFRRIGVRRGARMSRGRPTNVVLMDAVPEDFGASVLR